jgi:hypothetical protein
MAAERICLGCDAVNPPTASFCTQCGRSIAPPLRAWQALLISVGAGGMAAFSLLFSMADGGASARATLIAGAVAGLAAVILTFWLGWASWRVGQARRHARKGDDGH